MKKGWSLLFFMAVCFGLSACGTGGIPGVIQEGDFYAFKSMIEADKSRIHKEIWSGRTPLHFAAEYGKLDMAKYLVENGADVNDRDDYEYLPIHYAAMSGNLELIKYLIDKGAALYAKGYGGASVLHIAMSSDPDPAVFKYLISMGCDVNARDDYGSSVLHWAVQYGNVDLIKFLVAKGADITATDSSGQTPASSIQDWKEKDFPNKKEITSFLASVDWEQDTHIRSTPAQPSPAFQSPPNTFSEQTAASESRTLPLLPVSNTAKNVAVIIGNNQYNSFPSLKTAVNDARTVADLLKSRYNYETQLIINGSRLEILQTFDSLRSTLSSSSNLLIYYAGHGYYDEKADRGYWLPVDAQPDTTANWVSNADIVDKLKTIDAMHIMVVADSCFSGTLTRGIKITMREPDYYEKITSMRSRTVLTSGGLEPVVDSGGAGHSVFAQAFINALEQNTDTMDGTELFSQLRRPVMLNSDQTPQYSDIRKAGHEGGDFLFIRQ